METRLRLSSASHKSASRAPAAPPRRDRAALRRGSKGGDTTETTQRYLYKRQSCTRRAAKTWPSRGSKGGDETETIQRFP